MCAFLNFSLLCLPLADVAGAVLVLRAAGAAPDAVDVLVALRGVLGEVDACGWKEGRFGRAKKRKKEGQIGFRWPSLE